MRHPDSAFNLGTLILWWSHIFVSVLNGCHSIPHIPLPSANFLFCNLIPFPVMSGACSLQGELWYFYCQSSAFPLSLQFRLSLLAWTLLGRPPPRHPFLSHHKIGMIFLQLLLPPIPLFPFPFNCGYFPNRVFYLYSLSIYHLLWVRNQFYKFQWNAHHQIPVWWAVLTRSACRWFLMPISTHTASHLTAATVSPMGTWSVASASFQTYQVQGQAHEFSLQPASLHCYLSWWFG